MKQTIFITFMLMSLLFTACSSAGSAATPAATEIPVVVADTSIIAEGRVEPIHYAEIAFSAGGVVSEVLVQEGQAVKKGELLIRLGDESDTNYAAAQLELVSAQRAFDDLFDAADAQLAQAVIDLKEAQEDYDEAADYLVYLKTEPRVPQTRYTARLVKSGNGWRYDYETDHFKGRAPEDWIIEAENDLALKKARLEDAQRLYERLKDGPDSDQLPVLQARLEAAKAGVAAFAVTAPFDGVVAEMNAKEGSSINAGEIAVTVADFSSWLVKTTDLTEIDVVDVAEGQLVAVKLDAIPDVELNGKVLSIGQCYSESQGDVVYEVTILLMDELPAMRWGMTSEVIFENQD